LSLFIQRNPQQIGGKMRKQNQRYLVVTVFSLMILFTSAASFALVETGGIGIRVAQLYDYAPNATDHRGSIVVLDVFKRSSAHRAGIQKGDVILEVNDVISRHHDFNDILENHLRSPSYTQVTLVIWRSSTNEKLTVNIMREPTVY
jgi:C-terminal processing protease CtpA/Prc